jgi:hypothetical protein
MIRFRLLLLIAAGYPDADDCDVLRSDPAFKMAVGRAPESGKDLCSQPTMCRLENLPGVTALKRMMAAMVELFCDSFKAVPRRIVLDIDDTCDPADCLGAQERPVRRVGRRGSPLGDRGEPGSDSEAERGGVPGVAHRRARAHGLGPDQGYRT